MYQHYFADRPAGRVSSSMAAIFFWAISGIGLVVECRGLTPVRHLANRAQKGDHRAAIVPTHALGERAAWSIISLVNSIMAAASRSLLHDTTMVR